MIVYNSAFVFLCQTIIRCNDAYLNNVNDYGIQSFARLFESNFTGPYHVMLLSLLQFTDHNISPYNSWII